MKGVVYPFLPLLFIVEVFCSPGNHEKEDEMMHFMTNSKIKHMNKENAVATTRMNGRGELGC